MCVNFSMEPQENARIMGHFRVLGEKKVSHRGRDADKEWVLVHSCWFAENGWLKAESCFLASSQQQLRSVLHPQIQPFLENRR